MEQCQNLSQQVAQQLNENCACTSLDQEKLPTLEHAQSLISETPVYLPISVLEDMKGQIAAIEAAAKDPTIANRFLAQAPEIATIRDQSAGVFMGYDFHVRDNQAHLIEVNTNAGGISFVTALYQAQALCCDQMGQQFIAPTDKKILDMFADEWRANSGGNRPLKTIALIDEEPAEQFLYPEFLFFKQLFEQMASTAS